MKPIIVLIMISLSTQARGDDQKIIDYFLKQSYLILDRLEQAYPSGLNIRGKKIHHHVLRSSLVKTKIQVSHKELVDNQGSTVDAIGVPFSLILYSDQWVEFQRWNMEVKALILHELFRISGITDDGYPLSSSLYASLFSRNSEEQQVPYCNLYVREFNVSYSKKNIQAEGYQLIDFSGGVVVDTVRTKLVSFENAKLDAQEKCEAFGYSDLKVLSSQTRFMRTREKGKLISKQVTKLNVHCLKETLTKRNLREVTKEYCGKVKACEALYHLNIGDTLSRKLGLTQLRKQYRCIN